MSAGCSGGGQPGAAAGTAAGQCGWRGEDVGIGRDMGWVRQGRGRAGSGRGHFEHPLSAACGRTGGDIPRSTQATA